MVKYSSLFQIYFGNSSFSKYFLAENIDNVIDLAKRYSEHLNYGEIKNIHKIYDCSVIVDVSYD